jgi:hypothetical protein
LTLYTDLTGLQGGRSTTAGLQELRTNKSEALFEDFAVATFSAAGRLELIHASRAWRQVKAEPGFRLLTAVWSK